LIFLLEVDLQMEIGSHFGP